MNFRRGFFRIWAVFTWVVIVIATIMYEPWKALQATALGDLTEYSIYLEGDYRKLEFEGHNGIEQDAKALAGVIAKDRTENKLTENKLSVWGRQPGTPDEAATRVLKGAIRYPPPNIVAKENLAEYAGVAFIMPIGVLVSFSSFILTMQWIGRGFRGN